MASFPSLKLIFMALLLFAAMASFVRCEQEEGADAVPPPPPPPPEEDINGDEASKAPLEEQPTPPEVVKQDTTQEASSPASAVPPPPPPPSTDSGANEMEEAPSQSTPEVDLVSNEDMGRKEADAHPDDLLHNKEVTRRFWELKDKGFTKEEAWDYADMELRIKELTAPGHAKHFSSRERKNFKHQVTKLHHHIAHLDDILKRRMEGEEAIRNVKHDSRWTDQSRAEVIELRKQIEAEERLPLRLSLQRRLFKIYRDHKVRHREL